MRSYFPAEWAPQDGVLIAWPDSETDWRDLLDSATQYYIALAEAITRYQRLIVVCRNKSLVADLLHNCNQSRLILIELNYNDTWARDFGPLTVIQEDTIIIRDYKFNGWGGKFEASLDNKLTAALYQSGVFSKDVQYIPCLDFILEGGSVESNGAGVLLTTSSCLLTPTRNANLSREQIEQRLKADFYTKKVLWLENGELEGDDTDGHIDTLARFSDQSTIAYVSCTDKSDTHYLSLKEMERELSQLTDEKGRSFRLVALPMVDPLYNVDGRRLAATYANFLIINGAVLVPVYGVETDDKACKIISALFPGRDIVAIDCRVVIEQGGSLHCTTMQLPKGVLS